MTDYVEIILAIVGIVATSLGGLALKFYRDLQSFQAEAGAFMTAMQGAMDQIKKDNEDGKITEAEFNEEVNLIKGLMDKAQSTMKAGKICIEDLNEIKNQITAYLTKKVQK